MPCWLVCLLVGGPWLGGCPIGLVAVCAAKLAISWWGCWLASPKLEMALELVVELVLGQALVGSWHAPWQLDSKPRHTPCQLRRKLCQNFGSNLALLDFSCCR